jgi:hypothetical protein
VIIHQEIEEGPMAAEGARVSITSIAATVKRVISMPRKAFLKPLLFLVAVIAVSIRISPWYIGKNKTGNRQG